MSTKLFDVIPDICAEEIFVGSEEIVLECIDDDKDNSTPVGYFDSDDDGQDDGAPAPRGRADSGALLDMLAEVASQKLLTSPEKREDNQDGDSKAQLQFKGLSNNQLIHLFSKTQFDEMRRWYTYLCAFDENCTAKFVSFGNEERAKEKFKQHLFTHMENYSPATSQAKKVVKRRISKTNRTRKGKLKQPLIEELVDEPDSLTTESIIDDDDEDSESLKPQMDWTESFMLDEPENKVEVEMVSQETDTSAGPSEISSAVVDLNGLIAGLSEKMGVSGEHSYSSEEQGIVVYVVDGETMLLKSAPVVSHHVDVKSTEGSEYNVVRSAELPVIANKRSMSPPAPSVLLDPSALWELNQGENIERDEFHEKRKPKGKAKFIGQSRAEKEQAMEAMEAIRLKRGGSGIETLTCVICQPPRTFTAPTTLISHYRSHAGIKPYECRLCDAAFTRQHSLNYHMLIHQNQTRFTCQDCGRKFRHPSHFREHRRRHTGESPFECSDCLMRFKTRNTYKRHLRTRHGKVLTTSGGLIILSEDEFQMVRTAPRANAASQTKRLRPRKSDEGEMDAIDEDIKALHQLEIVTSNEGYESFEKEGEIEMSDDMPVDFLEDSDNGAYEEIVKEAVRLERAEAHEGSFQSQTIKQEDQPIEETLVIETEDPLSGSGLYLATLEDGETVLVNTRDDDDDDGSGRVDLGLKLLEVGKVQRNLHEPTVIVIKNESFQ